MAFCTVLAIAVLRAASADAQNKTTGFAESDFIVGGEHLVMIHCAQVSRELTTDWSLFAFGAVSDGFGEVYAGPRLSPAPWLTLSLAGGMQDNRDFRAAGSVLVTPDKLALFATGEINRSQETWFQAIASFRAHDLFAAGAFAQTAVGIGPYLELALPLEIPLVLWSSPMAFDWADGLHRSKHVVGLKAQF